MKRAKKISFFLILGLAAVICILHAPGLRVMAEEPSFPKVQRYYTSIKIGEGDSLWSIAQEYNTENTRMNTSEYIEELKKINNIREDVIHRGQYITIVYFGE